MKKTALLFISTLLLFSLQGSPHYNSLYEAVPEFINNPGTTNITSNTTKSEMQKVSVTNRSFDGAITAKIFKSVLVDDNNTKWFLTEAGIVSFDGKKWTLSDKNNSVPTQNLKDMAYQLSPEGAEVIIASPNGASVAILPINETSGVTTYNSETSPIQSNNVIKLAIGKGDIKWFGTDKGIAGLSNKKWFTPAYEDSYPAIIFQAYPITSMATSPEGDSLYVGTQGAGIARVYRDKVDAISGASVYAQWGPIILPSDNIYSVYIASDRSKWFGTDLGVAKHTGDNTLENWTVYTTDDGLVNNFVQAIAEDKKGRLWFGTKEGISVFDGTVWSSFTAADGLNSNNILTIAVDNDNVVWIGTDNGVISYGNDAFVSYK
jgi:ligand-binding sensor domain-containing protein